MLVTSKITICKIGLKEELRNAEATKIGIVQIGKIQIV